MTNRRIKFDFDENGPMELRHYICSVCMIEGESVQEHWDADFYCPACKPHNAEIERLRAENGRLRGELDEARGDYNMTAAILAEFRNGNRVMDSCFSCGEITEWFRQSTDDGGENYCTACGYCPEEEEAEDVPF